MKNKYKISLLLTGLLCFGSTLFAQQTYVNGNWDRVTGTVGVIHRTASALDNNQNLIVVSNTVNSSNNTDVLITKYNPQGDELWQQTFDGTAHGNDYAVQLKINSANEIFVASTLEESTGVDFGLLKYASNGTLVWSSSWNGSANDVDIPADLNIDNSGNVYLVGGSGTANGTADYAIVKFNANGAYQWHTNYDYANLHDVATSLDINSNTIVVTGASASSLANWDFATLQLNTSNGSIINTTRTVVAGVGLDKAVAVRTDANNNTYITGYVDLNGNHNIQTVKLNSNFGLEWVKNFQSTLKNEPKAIGVDDLGNVYVTGTTKNFNGGKDYITIKYDQGGTEIWNRLFGSEGNDFSATAEDLAVFGNGDVVVTGTLDKNNVKVFATIKYSTDGDLKFVEKFDAGSQNNEAKSVIVKDNSIYVSGISEVNGVIQNSTVKYSSSIRNKVVVTDSNGNDYIENVLLIRFDASVIYKYKIDDKRFTHGLLSDFIKPAALSKMNLKTGIDWTKVSTYKVHMKMTTADTTSLTRLGKIIRIPNFWATLAIHLPVGYSEQIIADSISTLSNTVQNAQRSSVSYLFSAPDDSFYLTEQTGLFSPVHGIRVEEAWGLNNQVGQPYTKIGIFDSGINWRHEDFGDGTQSGTKIVEGWDFSANTGNGISTFNQSTPDPGGHGTAVAGLLGAIRNNNKGIAGVAGGDFQDNNTGCELYSLKISSPWIDDEDIKEALTMGSNDNPNSNFGYGLHIQNHSWGGPSPSFELMEGVENCYKNNCIFVAASGNTNSAVTEYPASYQDEWVVKVGSNDASGKRYTLTNSTGIYGSTYGYDLDVIAPGTNDQYIGLTHNSNTGYTDFLGIKKLNGTSFASPLTAGVVGLLYSEHNTQNTNHTYPNNLAPEDVEHFLQSFATDVPPTGYHDESGYGRVNAEASLRRLSLPEYYVKHLGDSPVSSTETLLSSQPIVVNSNTFWGYNTNDLPNGTYLADRYEVNQTFTYNLLPTESLLNHWARNSSTKGVKWQGNNVNGATWMNYNLNTSQNTVTVTAKTFCWKVTTNSGVEWIPAPPSQLKMAVSLYIKDSQFSKIDENETPHEFSIYPNPSASEITINYVLHKSVISKFEIMDVLGNVVVSKEVGVETKGHKSITIDISLLAKGVYFCNFITGDKIISKRIIKQ